MNESLHHHREVFIKLKEVITLRSSTRIKLTHIRDTKIKYSTYDRDQFQYK
jgi:hypothetical protein